MGQGSRAGSASLPDTPNTFDSTPTCVQDHDAGGAADGAECVCRWIGCASAGLGVRALVGDGNVVDKVGAGVSGDGRTWTGRDRGAGVHGGGEGA
eukprot:361483-Chlamydomonas_euryale.AAC.2